MPFRTRSGAEPIVGIQRTKQLAARPSCRIVPRGRKTAVLGPEHRAFAASAAIEASRIVSGIGRSIVDDDNLEVG